MYFEAVQSEGKQFGNQIPRVVRDQYFADLVDLANQLHRALHAQPGRVGNLEPQFSVVALRAKRDCTKSEDDTALLRQRPILGDSQLGEIKLSIAGFRRRKPSSGFS